MIVLTEDNKRIDLSQGIDLSIPLSNDAQNPLAWYVEKPIITPVITEQWIGSVKKGGSVNFRNIFFNPHGHGTHTECLGHITEQVYSINQNLHQFFFRAVVHTVTPVQIGEDWVILKESLTNLLKHKQVDALIIRTLPNSTKKKSRKYSGTNPPYLDIACMEIINQLGVQHFLIDLPSVDKEVDGGVLAFHHAFWEVPDNPRFDRTITELIYVPNEVVDGAYFLNLQVAPFENDAAPSRPVIYPIQ